MKFTFKHLSGSRAGQEQTLDASVVGVGRNPTNQLAFDPTADDRVSGNHAQLIDVGGQVSINDMGSRNGTFLNGQKVTAPTPVPNGAVVQFGSEGGPKVLITYVASAPVAAAPAPAPPAAAPPPAKSGGGKGCMIGCIVFLLLGLCLGGAFAAYWFGLRDETEVSTATDGEAPPPSDEAPPATEAPPPATEAAPLVPTRKKTPWGKLAVGSTWTTKAVSEIKMEGMAPMKTESNTTMTVVSNDDTVVKLKMKTETLMAGMDPQVSELEQSSDVYVKEGKAEEGEKPLEERPDEVTVPAGSFKCTYRKTKAVVGGTETTTELWYDPEEPSFYKMVMTTPTMTMTSELTKLEKK